MRKRLVSLMLTLVMVLSLVPVTAVTAWAGNVATETEITENEEVSPTEISMEEASSTETPEEVEEEGLLMKTPLLLGAKTPVPYLDAAGTEQSCTNYTKVTDNTDRFDGGWYVVSGNVEIEGTVTVTGEVKLILCDGARLTVNGDDNCAGICVGGEGNSLTICAQTNGSGTLIANGGSMAAGIGGGYTGNGGNITINGGNVTANGGECGAGIGGGIGDTQEANSGNCSDVTINGGTVTANGGADASGIGLGYFGGTSENITVSGDLIVKADTNNPPTTVIPHYTGVDITEYLDSQTYAVIKPAVAKIVEDLSQYATVQDAIDQCQNGQTVKILVDVTENITIAREHVVTLDLNGYVLCGDGSNSVIINYGTLTVTDSNPSAIHKFAVASDTAWTWNDELESNYETVTGGCITGGTGTEENGSTETYGGGICNGSKYSSKLIVSGGNIVGNTADIGGGIYNNFNCSTTVSNCRIIGNTAAENGGGVYVSATRTQFGCFAAGTRITMADGSYKNIEDVAVGDYVESFNHETGKYEGNRVYLAYEGESAKRYFTLHFTNGIELSIYDRHDLFEQSANQYVTISEDNYSSFIGKKFYNAASGTWEELLSVTKSDDAKRYYSLYVAKTFNCIANDMLSVPDDADALLRMYTFREDLTADQAALQADIARYGLFAFEDCKLVDSLALYEELNVKYYNILRGKGLLTEEEVAAVFDEFFAENKSEQAKEQPALLTRIVNFFCATAYAGQLVPPDPLTIGSNVTIGANTVSGVANNVYLDSGEYICLTSDVTGISAGVTLENGCGRFTTNGTATDVRYFTSDNGAYIVKFVTDHLELGYGYEARSDAATTGTSIPNRYNEGDSNTYIQVTGITGSKAMGLAELAIAEKASHTDVNLKIVLHVATAGDTATGADAIKTKAAGKTLAFYGIDLIEYVDGAAVGTAIEDTNGKIIEVVIPYDLTGKTGVGVYRYHGTEAVAFTEAETGADGTFYVEGEGADAQIHLFSTLFSTYAIGYQETSSHGGQGERGGHGGDGSSASSGYTITSDLKTITKVTVDGVVIDSKYYTISDGNVVLTQAYLNTLSDGRHTVKLYNGDKVAATTITVKNNAVVKAARTGDMGIALYAGLAISSVLGTGAVVAARKRKEF